VRVRTHQEADSALPFAAFFTEVVDTTMLLGPMPVGPAQLGSTQNAANTRLRMAFANNARRTHRGSSTRQPAPFSRSTSPKVSAILLTPERSAQASNNRSPVDLGGQTSREGAAQGILVPTHFSWGGGGTLVEVWGELCSLFRDSSALCVEGDYAFAYTMLCAVS
jgi:hypothetical protein